MVDEKKMKYVSLGLLIFMNTAQVIAMRLARTHSTEKYNSTTAVVITEAMKIVMSFLLMVSENGSIKKAAVTIHQQVKENKREVVLQCVPALLYTIQNIFMYVAISNLDSGIFQICTRMKILITALLSVIFLGKHLRVIQWISLFILVVGICVIQVNKAKLNASGNTNFTIGFISVIISSTSSGLAGVFMEKMFKDKKLTVWNRNLWLAIWSMLVGLVTIAVQSPSILLPENFFKNYNLWAWAAIFLLAVGGLVIGMVLKYADNILKAFAGSASILISSLLSVWLFKFQITSNFLIGASLVMIAVVMYSYTPKKVEYVPLNKETV